MNNNHFKWDGPLIQSLEIIIDIVLIFTGFFIALTIQEGQIILTLEQAIEYLTSFYIPLILYGLLNIVLFRTYHTTITKRTFLSVVYRLGVALIISTMFVLLVTLVFYEIAVIQTAFFILALFIQIIILTIFKFFLGKFLKKVNIKNAVIIGPQQEVDEIVKKFTDADNAYIKLKYVVYDDLFNNGDLSKVHQFLESVDLVYLTTNLNDENKNRIITYCYKNLKTFYLIPRLYELSVNNARTNQVSDILMYEVPALQLSLEQKFVKRLFDVFTSLIGLIITSPIMIFIAIAIKIQDKGKIFYKQERMTRGNKVFTLYKFRTMIEDAEAKTGPVLAGASDNRITKLGNFLRKVRLDELPQLFNILKGEMSVVGPRPEREFFINQFVEENPAYQYRLNVKTGVTGVAQTLGTYNTSFEEKLRFDIYYITNYSFLKDISIILHTIRALFDPNSSKGVEDNQSLETHLNNNGYFLIATEVNFIKALVKR